MVSTKKAEKLFRDMLDDDFIQTFKPILSVQRCLGFQRVIVKYKFVTETSTMAQFYASAVIFFNFISTLNFVFNCEADLNAKFTNESLKLCLTLTSSITNVVIWRNNFWYGNLNSALYVKLQRLDRHLDMRDRRSHNKKLKMLAVCSTTAIVILAIVWILTLNFQTLKQGCPTTFATFPAFGIFTEMYLFVHIMLFLGKRVDFVNKLLQDLIKKKNKMICNNSSSWAIPALQVDSKNGTDVILAIHYVLDILADIMTLFQFQILAFIGQFVLWNFVTMRIFVHSLEEQTPIDVNSIINNVPLTIAMMALITAMSLVGGILTNKLGESKKICVSMTSYCEDKTRTSAKQILSMMIGNTFDISIYDIFNLNSQLPLDLLIITANYTIVFLQFAML